MGSLADDVMLGKGRHSIGGRALRCWEGVSLPCSLGEMVPVASLEVLVDSVVLISPNRLSTHETWGNAGTFFASDVKSC